MSDVKQVLSAQLHGVAEALRHGAGATEFARMLYAPDVIVAGEGWPRAIRGIEAFLPELTALLQGWGPRADLEFRIVDPVIDGENTATTLVDVHVAQRGSMPAAEDYRVFYAWRRTTAGWRVVAEMYTSGSF